MASYFFASYRLGMELTQTRHWEGFEFHSIPLFNQTDSAFIHSVYITSTIHSHYVCVALFELNGVVYNGQE